jgi:glycosyltransferase involved in cell wall biosynthesis
MNILFLSSWYPTKTSPNFGVFIKEHAHAIHLAGNNIVVLAIVASESEKIWHKTVSDFTDENGIRTIIVELNSRFRDLVYHSIPLQYYFALKITKQLRSSGFTPDIIHSNVIFPSGIIGSWISNRIRKPHIITEHWSRLNGFFKKPVLSYWGRKAYQKASKILPVSAFLQRNMASLFPHIPESKYSIVGNIIDSKTFFYSEKKKNPEKLMFCATATWAKKKTPDKQPELFIEALAQIQSEISAEIILTMIGGGNKVDELKRLCEELRVNSRFTGYINKNQIAIELQASDYFLHASTTETFSVVVAEALLCGVPVICSNVGALPELIDNSNGILCENTVEDWIKAIKKAISTHFEPAEIAYNIDKRFNLENIGKKISEVYKEI